MVAADGFQEDYVEYSRHGEVIRGGEKPVIRSKYEEHVLINNHTSVWGSFWKDFQWGYKCCHSFIKNSYCTGASGKDVQSSTASTMLMPSKVARGPWESVLEAKGDIGSQDKVPVPDALEEPTSSSALVQKQAIFAASATEKTKKKKKKKKAKKGKKEKSRKASSSSDSEDPEEKAEREKQEKIQKAMDEIDRDQDQETDERKRKYNSMYNVKAPTEEEMEAYFMKRKRSDDPMASFI